jgi:hypothetical protein
MTPEELRAQKIIAEIKQRCSERACQECGRSQTDRNMRMVSQTEDVFIGKLICFCGNEVSTFMLSASDAP